MGFYDIEAWGDTFTAAIARNGVKGRGVRVVGRIKQNRWKTTDGRNITKTFVVAEHVDFRPLFDRSTYSAALARNGGTSATAGTVSTDADEEAYQAEIDNLALAAEGIRSEQAVPVVEEVEDCVF